MFHATKVFQAQIEANIASYTTRHGNSHLRVFNTYKRRSINYKPSVALNSRLCSKFIVSVPVVVNSRGIRDTCPTFSADITNIVIPNENNIFVINPTDLYHLNPSIVVSNVIKNKPARFALAYMFDNDMSARECLNTEDMAQYHRYAANYSTCTVGTSQLVWFEFDSGRTFVYDNNKHITHAQLSL